MPTDTHARSLHPHATLCIHECPSPSHVRLLRPCTRRGGHPRHNAKRDQCTAGVGTLLLEFGTLSRLSLDPRFEDAALCALRLLWSKRSPRDLLGNTLNMKSGAWSNPSAGIGAGIDSFYEYAPLLTTPWSSSYH